VPKVGVTCSSASDCTSGYCVDGYCCDGACNGQCQACDLPGSEGKCTPVVGEQPHGARTRCSDGGGDLCKALQCDGSKDVTKCVSYANGPDKVCEQACTDGTASVAVCDGSGACGTPDKKSCGAFVCDVSTCKTSCASESDCAPGYTCDAASKKCVPQKTTATCSADGTASISADKSSTKPCAPYLCNTSSGDCYATCTGSEQCAGGTVCEQGSCVAHQADGDTGGGCRFSTREVRGRRANGLSVAFAALVALGLMCRRR
jgi:hypothetical protein